ADQVHQEVAVGLLLLDLQLREHLDLRDEVRLLLLAVGLDLQLAPGRHPNDSAGADRILVAQLLARLGPRFEQLDLAVLQLGQLVPDAAFRLAGAPRSSRWRSAPERSRSLRL